MAESKAWKSARQEERQLCKRDAHALGGAMLQEADASADERVSKDVLFASQVLDLKLYAMQMGPGGREAQEGA